MDSFKTIKLENGQNPNANNHFDVFNDIINRDMQATEIKNSCENLKKDKLNNEFTPNMDVWEKR